MLLYQLVELDRVGLLDRVEPDETHVAARANVPSSSSTYATPPLMPAAKLRPVRPRITSRPPVMYSQP